MPFSTGLAKTPSVILKAINDLGVANGWVKLRGEEDMNVQTPITAKFWRINVWQDSHAGPDWREIGSIGFRETVGGSNLTGGTWSTSSSAAPGTLPGTTRSEDIDDQGWWVQYEHPTPVIVREMVLAADTASEAPRDFAVQWSHDGITWTTMGEYTDLAWGGAEIKYFSWADATFWNGHADATSPRRSGGKEWWTAPVAATADPERFASEDYWIWQLPGYDADTRIYLHARGRPRLIDATHHIQFAVSPSYDPAKVDWGNQVGWNDQQSYVSHIMNANEGTYWIYLNGHRLILVTKSGTDDYSSTYVGNLAAFAPPADYPFPLFMASTCYDINTGHNEANNAWSGAHDPGRDCAWLRMVDNTWRKVFNRTSNTTSRQLYTNAMPSWVYPFHVGASARDAWPYSMVGDYFDGEGHWLNSLVPTAQDDHALFPLIVKDAAYGNIGYMDGMYAVAGSTLLPEQTFTIGATNYRVFCTRNLRDGNNFFVVRED